MSKLPIENELGAVERTLSIVSDLTRLKILYSLFNEDECHHDCNAECELCHHRVEKTVGEIMESVKASQSLISHQLSILRNANLVQARKQGKNVYYSLKDGHVKLLLQVVYEHIKEEEEKL